MLLLCPQVRDEGRGGEVVCVRWNSSLNCGSGGWQSTGCRLSDHTSGSQLTCVCTDSGTFSVLDVIHLYLLAQLDWGISDKL